MKSVNRSRTLPQDGLSVRRAMAVLTLAVCLCAASLPAYCQAADVPLWDPAGIADFELQECRGRTITKDDLLGQPWLAAFIFTRCAGPCPLVSAEMKKLQQATRDLPLRLVSITVDPDTDTPEVLKFYADQLGADPERWWFLTGDKAAIFNLIRGSFRMVVADADDPKPGFEVIHSIEIMHVNEQGVVVGRYNARNDVQMARLKNVLLGKMTAEEAQRLNAVPVLDEPTSEADQTESADRPEPAVGPASGRVPLPVWITRLPTINALLNTVATLYLVAGYLLIRRGKVAAHATVMISAFVTSAVFLSTYLTYHFALKHYTGSSSQPYQGPESLRILYYLILVPHVLLAPIATALALATIFQAARRNWSTHRKLARITFPIWLYVSVTGVIIYLMVYHLPRAQ
ncbi:MAG: DUF420 domain-containing protein [Planctomycetaceae bacterium]|nr:MAG: DUF420 domain-containing protein [Planctomycetaceae bacterium]